MKQQELLNHWADKLDSGEYIQVRGEDTMKGENPNEFCVFGVLWNEMSKMGYFETTDSGWPIDYDTPTSVLFGITSEESNFIQSMNDKHGNTFEEIASHIRTLNTDNQEISEVLGLTPTT